MSETRPCADVRNLQQAIYAMGVTHWVYKAGNDGFLSVLSERYWDPVRGPGLLAAGDHITVSAKTYSLILWVTQAIPTVKVIPIAGRTLSGERLA